MGRERAIVLLAIVTASGACGDPPSSDGSFPSADAAVPAADGMTGADAAVADARVAYSDGGDAGTDAAMRDDAADAGWARAELGVHDNPACNSQGPIGIPLMAEFTTWLGHPPDRVMDFVWYETWSKIVSSSESLPACWKSAGYQKLTMTVPMIPDDGVSTLADVASGAHDASFTDAAHGIAASYPDAVLRIGWEFNLADYPWAAAKDPTHWVAAYRHIVDVFRAVSPLFRFDWNPAFDLAPSASGHVPPVDYWPGDAYVDFVGVDFYDKDLGADTPADRWNGFLTFQYGLNWHASFAALHGKRMSYPEWGVGTNPSKTGNGDDPYFITQMAAWVAAHDVAYYDYFDEDTTGWTGRLSSTTTSQFPNAAIAFKAAF